MTTNKRIVELDAVLEMLSKVSSEPHFIEEKMLLSELPSIPNPIEMIEKEKERFNRTYKDVDSYTENGKGYHTGYNNALQELLSKLKS